MRILIAGDYPIVRERLIAVFALEDDVKDRADPLHRRTL
jgi:hypothetical protein